MENLAFLTDPKWIATRSVVVCYVVLFSEKVNRAVTTLIAAMFMILAGVVTQNEAFSSIDFNTISLLVGMMVIVSITERSGLFNLLPCGAHKKCEQIRSG